MTNRPLALMVLLALATAVTPDAIHAQSARLGGEVRFSGLAFDNFFQSPDDVPEKSVTAGAIDALVGPRLANSPVWIYGRAGATAYEGLDTSVLLGAGVRIDGRRHALDLRFSRETDRPTLDIGDDVEPATVVRTTGEYGFRVTDDWEVKGLGDFESLDFEVSKSQDGEFASAGGAIRWRGLGHEFSPEVGATLGARDADDPTEDYDQSEVYLQVRSVPVNRLYFSARYRYRTRDYTIDDPALDNFGREDTRHQVVFLGDYRLTGSLSVFTYWAWEDADSTVETRVFTTQYVIAGLTGRW